MIINFEGLREQLTDEQVKDILLQYNVEPCIENADTIIFPTCCHNLTGGSPKLYYYKDSKRFHCYTECDSSFDIFDLLRRRHKLRGQDISVIDAINICGLTLDGIATTDNQQINPQNADDKLRIYFFLKVFKPFYLCSHYGKFYKGHIAIMYF